MGLGDDGATKRAGYTYAYALPLPPCLALGSLWVYREIYIPLCTLSLQPSSVMKGETPTFFLKLSSKTTLAITRFDTGTIRLS